MKKSVLFKRLVAMQIALEKAPFYLNLNSTAPLDEDFTVLQSHAFYLWLSTVIYLDR